MSYIDLPVKKHTFLKRLSRKLKGESFIRHYFDENKCIFVHIPKVAGSSVKGCLFPNQKGPGHRMAMDYYLENPGKFQEYFVFCFVRNPYDRLVSAYFYLMGGGKGPADVRFRDNHLLAYKDFPDFLRNGLSRPEVASWWHFRPQYFYLVNFEGELIVDYIGRFENLDNDFNEICKKLGVTAELPHSNKSKRSTYGKYFDKELQDIAYNFYQKDFELLGYSKDIIDED